MRLWLLGLGREGRQSTGKVLRVVKVMDEVGMGALLQNPDTAQTWGHSLGAAQNMHRDFAEIVENSWMLLPEKVWKQEVPQADEFMDNRFIQIEMELG